MSLLDLPDGRRLDVLVSGPAGGVPLVYHHGTPGSLLPERGMVSGAHERGLRFVSYSRAGYGDSTRNPGRTVADVAVDIVAILDHLEAPRCLVAGKSGGGPHALATAALLPDRVAGVCSIAGAGPHGVADLDFLAGMGEDNVEEFALALQGEAALRPWLEQHRPELLDVSAEQLIDAMSSLLPAVDREVLTGEYCADLVARITEGLRHGVDGWLDDDLAFTKPWGFDLEQLTVPAFVWQGTADLMVPLAHGRWLAEHVPGATTHLVDGAGHLSIEVGTEDQILDELVGTL